MSSLYYDTPALRFYWEKIEGLKFRRKLRMRLYGAPAECTGGTPVQIEIEQRVNRVTQKRRIALPYEQAMHSTWRVTCGNSVAGVQEGR